MNMKAYTIHPPGQAQRITVVVRRGAVGGGKGKALLDSVTRDRLLAEAAEGASDAELAADYGLTEQQARRLRHNNRVKLQALRRDLAARAEAADEEETLEVPPPLNVSSSDVLEVYGWNGVGLESDVCKNMSLSVGSTGMPLSADGTTVVFAPSPSFGGVSRVVCFRCYSCGDSAVTSVFMASLGPEPGDKDDATFSPSYAVSGSTAEVTLYGKEGEDLSGARLYLSYGTTDLTTACSGLPLGDPTVGVSGDGSTPGVLFVQLPIEMHFSGPAVLCGMCGNCTTPSWDPLGVMDILYPPVLTGVVDEGGVRVRVRTFIWTRCWLKLQTLTWTAFITMKLCARGGCTISGSIR